MTKEDTLRMTWVDMEELQCSHHLPGALLQIWEALHRVNLALDKEEGNLIY